VPRSQKLKVYRTPIGFHDAYVAAPSQKAALEAWGSDVNLFARGIAEIVTDEALMEEPLASPGAVIRRLRGTPEEQIAALPPDRPRVRRPSTTSDTDTLRPRKTVSKSTAPDTPARAEIKRPAPKPRPSRAKLEETERRLDELLQQQKKADEELRTRERQLARERRDLNQSQQRERRGAERRVEKEKEAHIAALSRWRASH
jgi:hypothetical protein